jgi:hypothetical protein
MFHHCPCNRETIKRRSAASYFVQYNQRFWGCLIKDSGGLNHLNHKSGTPAREIISSAHAAEEFIYNAYMRAFRWHERTHLRKYGNKRILAQECAFARHIRAGEQPQALRCAKITVIAYESFFVRFGKHGFHNRVTAATNIE